MRISDWSSDVCSSDLGDDEADHHAPEQVHAGEAGGCGRRRGDAAGERVARRVEETLAADHRAQIAEHPRSEEHTSELQSLMRISYAVFCLKKKTQHNNTTTYTNIQKY